MRDVEKSELFGAFRAPSDEDTASVFCFRENHDFLRAADVVEKAAPEYWIEKRKATTGAMYPYWLICRPDTFEKIGGLLKKNGINWDDVESHFYKGVKAQSGIHALEEDLADEKPKSAGQHAKTKSEPKRWWRIWE
jgi:hypothetical protein